MNDTLNLLLAASRALTDWLILYGLKLLKLMPTMIAFVAIGRHSFFLL